jgi:hypothetical protein
MSELSKGKSSPKSSNQNCESITDAPIEIYLLQEIIHITEFCQLYFTHSSTFPHRIDP